MKRVLCAAIPLIALAAAPLPACDRSASYAPNVALAVPVFVSDHYAAPAAVFVAPVVDPLIVVSRPVFVPRARVQVFSPRSRVRVFVR